MSQAQHIITDHITNNIATWTSAILAKSSAGRGSSNKYELYGIKKLRELILELAVRGKLVPQDPSDEPASVLLDRIAAEKAELRKAKKIKKTKALPEIAEDEKPFELPAGWEWCRLQDVGHDWGQKIPDEEFTYIDVGSVNKELGIIEEPSVLASTDAPSRARKKVEEGTVIYSTVRPYLLNIAVIDKKFKPEPIASTAFAIVHPLSGMSGGFIYRYLRSPSFVEYVESCQTGVAYPAINDKQFFSGLIPVPPAQEQHSIVAKVDELMALCDQLEQQTESSIEAHTTLVDTLLATFTNSADADELQQSWARIAGHFDTLFTTERSIDALKQTILQLAVMGKLVRQNPNDEPAAVLLERIAAEKDRLVKEKKIKKQKPLPEITEDEKPFELPAGWNWCRLDALSLSSEAGWSPQCEPTPREGDNWGVLKVSAVTWGSFNPEENKALPKGMSPRTQYEVKHGDFLISRANTAELVARAVVVPADTPSHLMMSDKIIRFTFSTYAVSEYINLVNSCNYSREYYATVAGGTSSSMKNVSRNQIRDLVIPLPPFNEQHRIIAKVDKLMALCDQLQDKLRQSQQTQVHLTDAIVEQAMVEGQGV